MTLKRSGSKFWKNCWPFCFDSCFSREITFTDDDFFVIAGSEEYRTKSDSSLSFIAVPELCLEKSMFKPCLKCSLSCKTDPFTEDWFNVEFYNRWVNSLIVWDCIDRSCYLRVLLFKLSCNFIIEKAWIDILFLLAIFVFETEAEVWPAIYAPKPESGELDKLSISEFSS